MATSNVKEEWDTREEEEDVVPANEGSGSKEEEPANEGGGSSEGEGSDDPRKRGEVLRESMTSKP